MKLSVYNTWYCHSSSLPPLLKVMLVASLGCCVGIISTVSGIRDCVGLISN